MRVVLFVTMSGRTLVTWDTDIALLAGQEISVELKDSLDFPATTNIAHNFVSTRYHSAILMLPLQLYSVIIGRFCNHICSM